MKTTVGTCGCCGGRVSVPMVWHGVVPPIPTCESCGATVRQAFGPVLPMDPPRKQRFAGSSTALRDEGWGG